MGGVSNLRPGTITVVSLRWLRSGVFSRRKVALVDHIPGGVVGTHGPASGFPGQAAAVFRAHAVAGNISGGVAGIDMDLATNRPD